MPIAVIKPFTVLLIRARMLDGWCKKGLVLASLIAERKTGHMFRIKSKIDHDTDRKMSSENKKE